jgi:hypothetical protein
MSTSEQQQIEQLKSEALALKDEATGISIGNEMEYVAAVEMRKQVKTADRKIDAFYEPMETHLNGLVKAMRASKAILKGTIKETLELYDRAIIGWQATQERHAQEQQAVLQAQADTLGEDAPIIKIDPLVPGVGGLLFREVWSVELEDLHTFVKFAAENPVFIPLLMLNQPAANAMARSQHGSMNVPGLRSVCNKVLVQRG